MRTLFFTGSGLSADSGLRTFRGADGLYEGRPAEEWLTNKEYKKNPEFIDRFIDELRVAVGRAEPNAAHIGIAKYCEEYPETVVLTQNIDDLLERAGVPFVVHLHGHIRRLRCLGFSHRFEIGYERDPSLRCPKCNSRLRPDVVFFHEGAPEYRTMYRMFDAQDPSDALVVIGTQGGVISIGDAARMMPGLRILNNLHRSPFIDDAVFHHTFYQSAAEAFPAIRSILDSWRNDQAGKADLES